MNVEETIPAALDGERLDRIVALIADISRSEARQLIEAGGATVDGVADFNRELAETIRRNACQALLRMLLVGV